MKRAVSTEKVILINTLSIVGAVIIAIVVKAFLPSNVNVEDFDSVLVSLLGFPTVAILYFVILFMHCIMVMQYFGGKSHLSKIQIGFRFGTVFAALYLFGMQEVVVEASPFNEWGFPFIRYQLIIGITDAIPALLLCVVTSYFILTEKKTSGSMQVLNIANSIKIVTLVTITFLIQRTIGYETGIVSSNSASFPIPTYLWTIVFGIVLGASYVFLYPIFFRVQNKFLQSFYIVVITIGINWVIFNSFIGLIFKDVMGQMLLRTGIDVAVFYLASIIIYKYIIKTDRDKDTDANDSSI